MQITTKIVEGTQVIGTSDLKYCNTKYHPPYLTVVRGEDMDWQDKVYVGYGKHRQTFYDVSKLQPGDLIKAAAGSGGNKYPFTGRVVAIADDEIEVEEMSLIDFGNAAKAYAPTQLTEDELVIVSQLKTLSPDRLSLILAAVRNGKEN